MQGTVLAETEAFLDKQRGSLIVQRQELVAQLDELDVMLTKFDVFEGKARPRQQGQNRGSSGDRRGSRRGELLKIVSGSKGLTRGEILEKMGLKGDKRARCLSRMPGPLWRSGNKFFGGIEGMSPLGSDRAPTKTPNDLWLDIQRVKRRLAAFIADAQFSVRDQEVRTGQHDMSFYA
jgi:hypothetical protein